MFPDVRSCRKMSFRAEMPLLEADSTGKPAQNGRFFVAENDLHNFFKKVRKGP